MQEPSNDCHVQRGFEDLANAIVLQAVEDYRAAVRRERKYAAMPKDRRFYSNRNHQYGTAAEIAERARCEQKQLEKFFTSIWCQTLTTVNGALIVQQLQKEKRDLPKRKKPHRGKRDGG